MGIGLDAGRSRQAAPMPGPKAYIQTTGTLNGDHRLMLQVPLIEHVLANHYFSFFNYIFHFSLTLFPSTASLPLSFILLC